MFVVNPLYPFILGFMLYSYLVLFAQYILRDWLEIMSLI